MSIGLTRRSFLANLIEPSKRNLLVGIIAVSPELAAEWLTFNKKNRPLKRKFIQRLVGQILRGRYRLNGETIIFSAEGFLLDGQNRLHAIIQSGETLECLVVYGIDAEDQKTIDTGNQRGISDAFHMEDEKSPAVLAAATRTFYGWANDLLGREHTPGLLPNEAADILELFPELRDSIKPTRCCRGTVSCGYAAGLYTVFAAIDTARANQFFHALGTGENLSKSDPIYKLRRTIQGIARSNGLRNMRKNVLFAWIIKCWNVWMEDGARISYKNDDALNFPEVNGVPRKFLERCKEIVIEIEEPVAAG